MDNLEIAALKNEINYLERRVAQLEDLVKKESDVISGLIQNQKELSQIQKDEQRIMTNMVEWIKSLRK